MEKVGKRGGWGREEGGGGHQDPPSLSWQTLSVSPCWGVWARLCSPHSRGSPKVKLERARAGLQWPFLEEPS